MSELKVAFAILVSFVFSLAQSEMSFTCDDIEKSDSFKLITNALVGTCSKTQCLVKCNEGYHVSHMAYTVPANCVCSDSGTQCRWSYGNFGHGIGGEKPNWGCCLSPDRTYGHAWSNVMLQRNYGKKFVEADNHSALVSNKIVAKDTAEAGYSVLLVFDGILDDDVSLRTFARMVVTDIYRDHATDQTFIMMNSNVGFETLEIGEKFDLVFLIETTSTDAKELVETINYKIKFYATRHSTFCAGNEELSEHLNPSPIHFGSFNIQVFGKSKYNKDVVKDNIVALLKRYDVVTIQEIRDSSETAFPNLVADMNTDDDKYDWHMGARQGSTSSKEQYGFIWDRTKIKLHDAYDFDDTEGWFERPPTVCYFDRLNENAKENGFE